MHLLKFCLLLASCGVAAALAMGLLWHVPASLRAPWIWTATGSVVEVQAPPAGDAERVPSSGPTIVVEFKDYKGELKRQSYGSFNSGGATPFAGRKAGETFQFDLEIPESAPGARRGYDWKDAGKMHGALGAALLAIGALLYLL